MKGGTRTGEKEDANRVSVRKPDLGLDGRIILK